jgi:hypothetical protein
MTVRLSLSTYRSRLNGFARAAPPDCSCAHAVNFPLEKITEHHELKDERGKQDIDVIVPAHPALP